MDIYKSNYTGQQIDNFLSNANQAASDANSAAQLANSSAETANNAADTANAAAATATQAAQSANEAAAGITQTLANKADLDPSSKTILPAEVAPLLGRQQGVDTSNGYFQTSSLKSILESNHTVEVLFTTGEDITSLQVIFGSAGNAIGPQIFIQNGQCTQFWGWGSSFAINPNTTYHLIMTYDVTTRAVMRMNNGSIANGTGASGYLVMDSAVIGNNTSYKGPFTGTIHHCRVFNYALSEEAALTLWNDGRPDLYMLPASMKGSGENGCVAEYLPCGLLSDSWRDTSGNAIDLTASGTPVFDYNAPQRLDTVIVDTGLFVTDIASGTASKSINVPNGYVITHISVYNANATELTAISASMNGTALFSNQSVNPTAPLWVTPVNALAYKTSNNSVTVNATGNTSTGGMRVQVVCRWLGF